MAIRLLNSETNTVIMDVNFRVEDLGSSQLVTGFKEDVETSGIIHTQARKFPEDTSHIVVIHKGKPVRVTLTTISPNEIIAEGY